MTSHPSFLALDRAALGAALDPAARAHVDGCERCQAHVDRVQRAEPPAPWLRALPPARPAWRSWRWGGGLALAAATACALLLLVRARGRGDDDRAGAGATTAKGAPEVLLHIKRGDSVTTWDGAAPVIPGDRLRLEIAPSGYRRVQVIGSGGALLHDAPLRAPGLLPVAWEVDDQPGPETLTVILTDHPRDRAWRTTLTLPKSEPP
ncbi:MAG TPA: hypothetical protein VMZ28_16605 [Kofleriaceae bacterium]|nr:hypothetical protein [Kofleriaceae bacterium]